MADEYFDSQSPLDQQLIDSEQLLEDEIREENSENNLSQGFDGENETIVEYFVPIDLDEENANDPNLTTILSEEIINKNSTDDDAAAVATVEENEDENDEENVDENDEENEEVKASTNVTAAAATTSSTVPSVDPHASLRAFLDDDNDDEGSDFEGYEVEANAGVDVDGIMTNIFGESDDNEEFEGFAETELGNAAPSTSANANDNANSQEQQRKKHLTKKRVQSNEFVNSGQAGGGEGDGDDDSSGSSSDDNQGGDEIQGEEGEGILNDFDRLMESKREVQRRKKRKHDRSYIGDSDDTISKIVQRMHEVAEEDRELVKLRQPAVKKLKMLPVVTDLLIKAHHHSTMIQEGILNSIMDWLSPLPDHSLPSLPVREELVKALLDFPLLDSDNLKESGIGKAIMYLRRHPKEEIHVKLMCSKLIDKWSRVIFQQNTDYKSLSREERIKRDQEHLEKRRRTEVQVRSRRDLARDLDSEERPLRPGDPGFMSRARVPQPSNRDYLVRPEWKVKTAVGTSQQRDDDSEVVTKQKRFDRHFRLLKQKKRSGKGGSAAISVEGRKMAL